MPVALLHRRVRPLPLVAAGVAVFAAASVVAGFAGSLTVLLVARGAQGVGATLLLAGSLPVLAAIVPGQGRARRWWALAGAVGAAVGPALGGVLTQLFDWRAIFFVQAPIVAAALVVAIEPGRPRPAPRGARRTARRGPATRDVIVANIGFALVFAALVAALFLGVLLAIEVWRYSPMQGAALVSALPLGMAVGRRFQGAPGPVVAVGGALLLAAGLAGLGLLPGAEPVMAALAFAVCGAGFDLVHEVLDGAAVPADGPAIRASAVSIGARHAGLVLGLALIAPVLSASLEAGIERATLGATQTMLTTDLDLRDKIPVTWALRNAIEEAPRGQVPDLAGEFDERGAEGDNEMAQARDALMDTRDRRRDALVPAGVRDRRAARRARRDPGPARRRTHASRRRSARRRSVPVGVGSPRPRGPRAARRRARRRRARRRRVRRRGSLHGATRPVPRRRPRRVDPAHRPVDAERRGVRAGHDARAPRPVARRLEPLRRRDVGRRAARTGAAGRAPTAPSTTPTTATRSPGWAAAALGFLVDRAPVGWLIDRIDLPGG